MQTRAGMNPCNEACLPHDSALQADVSPSDTMRLHHSTWARPGPIHGVTHPVVLSQHYRYLAESYISCKLMHCHPGHNCVPL